LLKRKREERKEVELSCSDRNLRGIGLGSVRWEIVGRKLLLTLFEGGMEGKGSLR